MMNGLSWLIYGADAVARLGDLFALVAIFGAISAVVIVVIGLIARSDASGKLHKSYYDNDEKANARQTISFIDAIFTRLKFIVVLVVGCAFISAIIPSRSTLYMIAASEMGEKVYQQPETKEMLGDLRQIVMQQLKKLKDDK